VLLFIADAWVDHAKSADGCRAMARLGRAWELIEPLVEAHERPAVQRSPANRQSSRSCLDERHRDRCFVPKAVRQDGMGLG
jgi:hypothetical protein